MVMGELLLPHQDPQAIKKEGVYDDESLLPLSAPSSLLVLPTS